MIISNLRNCLSPGGVALLCLLLLPGVTPVSLADAKQSYYFALNETEVSVLQDEVAPLATSNQVDGRDCNSLNYEITLFTPCEGEDSARLWR